MHEECSRGIQIPRAISVPKVPVYPWWRFVPEIALDSSLIVREVDEQIYRF